MKTKSYLIGLLLLAAGLITITTTNNKAQAQGNSRQPHWVIIMSDRDTYYYTNGGNLVNGVVVDWVDASPSAPPVNIGASFSETLAYLMDNGGTWQYLAGRRYIVTR